MAESTISLAYADMVSEIGHFLGYGRTSGNWVAAQTTEIEVYLNQGCRQFYFHEPLDFAPSHEWSFLKPYTTLAVSVAGGYDYTLPDDFGGMIGDFFFAAEEGAGPIKERSSQQLIEQRQYSADSGKPCMYAIRNQTTPGVAGQRWEALFWPIPDASYTLTYQYRVQPADLTSGAPYPYGGAAYGETILAACLSVAELRLYDQAGAHRENYTRLLRAAVMEDLRRQPKSLGYNGDSSDGYGSYRKTVYPWRQAAVNGSVPS